MNSLVASLRSVEQSLRTERGEWALFACFEPADSIDHWDLIVSAAWAPRHDRRTIDRIVSALDDSLTPQDRLSISRVAVVEPSDEDVQRLNARFDGHDQCWSVRGEEYFGYVVGRGFVLASNDYWRFVKQLFPEDASIVFFTRDADLHIRVSWKLGTDPSRPNKRSRTIVIRISREALEDHIYVDDDRRRAAEDKLISYLLFKLSTFSADHARLSHQEPPTEEWRVTTALFQRPVATAG